MPKPDDRFPEVVLHGAARLNPRLKVYYERLPRTMSHSGGYYTMTKENWPLIGPAWPYGRFVVGVISGFGTFAALRQDVWPPHWQRGGGTGLCALLGLTRSDDPEFVAGLEKIARSSVL